MFVHLNSYIHIYHSPVYKNSNPLLQAALTPFRKKEQSLKYVFLLQSEHGFAKTGENTTYLSKLLLVLALKVSDNVFIK